MYEFTTETTGYRGYVGSRCYSYGEYPQSVQNLLIRTYCQKHGMTYLLSATEYAMPRCYMMLEDVVNSIDTLQGIVLFSIFMLPECRQKRARIYQKVLAAGKSLHAALEDLSIKKQEDIQMIEDILNINRIMMPESQLRQFVDRQQVNADLACA